MRSLLFLMLALNSCSAPPAPPGPRPDASALTVDRIFGSREFSGEGPSARWRSGGSLAMTVERSSLIGRDATTGRSEVLVSPKDLVPEGASAPLSIDGYQESQDFSRILIYTQSRRVWRQNTRGDYWVLDRRTRSLRKLGGDAPPSSLMFAKFSPSGRQVAFVRERNIYLEDLEDRSIRCLTRAEDPKIVNGTADWVYEEEFDLRDGFSWSPRGDFIAFWQIDSRGVPEFPLVDTAKKLVPKVTWISYPKVGQVNPSARVGIIDLGTLETRWLDIPGDGRNHYLPRMDWAPGSGELLVQQLNRLQNTNRLLLCDPRTGAVRTILTEQDEAWVDVHEELLWLDGGRKFTWISERDGWRHVYIVPRSGEGMTLATPGPYDVLRLLKVDRAGEWIYYLAAPDEPARRYLFRSRTDGSRTERLTPSGSPGTHEYSISADDHWAFHTYSTFDRPPVTELVELPSHRVHLTLADNATLRSKLEPLRLAPTEFFRVDIGGGVTLDGWCIKPATLDPRSKHPLLVHVYGEPAGQTVLDRWGGSQTLWHQMLAQQGYVVMSFDNRGTPAPRGRDWRKSVYRKIGILAPQDQAAAVRKVLEERPYLDPARVGVWGWSGGGSMSLNAIFKFPDLYRTAIAIASVPNQRGYDTIYQERYMGLPQDNDAGYREGSPITHARGLQGNLLLIHGTGDDNCHYATTELLIDELVKQHKQFSMFAYPGRSHSISEGENTTRHLRELMTRFLLEKLPPNRVPADR